MGMFPKSKRHAESTFTGTKNLADAIDKMASVAVAFGFGDPTGATLTIAAAVSLSAKAIGAVSTALIEIAKTPNAPGDANLRTTLILCVGNEAYFKALEEILTARLPDIGTTKIPKSSVSDLEEAIAKDDPTALLHGQCSLFAAYEQQLKAALIGAGVIWTTRERLAEQISDRARTLLQELLAKNSEPYATLRNRLSNEALASMPKKVVDELDRRRVPTARQETSVQAQGLPVQPISEETIEPMSRGIQAIQNQLARMEQHMSSTSQLQASAAIEVSAQLRANKIMFDQAKIFLEVGKLGAAMPLFETVVAELSPLTTEEAINLRARAMANIGHCHHRQGREADAIRLFRESYALAPRNVRLRINSAVADLLEGKLEDAETALDLIYQERPEEDDVLELLAEAITQRGNPKAALALLEVSPRTNEHYLCCVSGIYLKIGRNIEAEKVAREATQRFPHSHQAAFALAVAIAAPILNRDDVGQLISATERKHLREAAEHLHKAATIARREEQRTRVGLYLNNLCGVQSAVGEFETAVNAGLEAKEITPEDPVLLRNLFVAHLMLERYNDAAAIAREIGRLIPGPEAISREMHALIGANRYDDALASFDAAVAIPGVDSDARLLALRVECLRKLPDLDAAERALEEAYLKVGRVTELTLQEAWMRSVAGQHEIADRLFTEAEHIAVDRERIVARRRYGLYLYRRRRWAEAASRLLEYGEDPIASVVIVEYLHCLFELKRMPEVAEIGCAIIEDGVFRATIWELAAQALAALGRLREAEKLFRELVHHQPTEKQHLALAGICYRARGLNAAIKVLEAAQTQHPKSYYVQANLSGFYFARREYRKAFDAAKRAVEIAPTRQEGHTAMVRILGSGDQLKLSDSEKKLLQKSLSRSKAIRQFEIKTKGDDIDLSEIIAVLKEQSTHAQRAMDAYRKNRLPVTILAEILSRPIIDVYFSITRSPTERIFVGSGTSEEQEAEHKLAKSAESVILDASSLLTLQSLGLLQGVTRRFPKIHVATATFEKLSEELETLKAYAVSTSTMGYNEGHIQIIDIGPEVHAQKVSILEEIVSFLESDSATLEGLDAKSWADWKQRETQGLKAWMMHPILIAKAKNWALYSDEHCFRAMAQNSHGVTGFNSQAFLRTLVDIGALDDAGYHQAVVNLIGLNFDFVSLNLDDFLWHLKQSNYIRSEVFGKMLRQLQASAYNDKKSPWILGGLIGHLWFERSGNDKDRAEWVGLCIDSLNTAKHPEITILEVLAAAGVQLAHFPEAFIALTHYLREKSHLHAKARATVGNWSFDIFKVLADSFSKTVNLGVEHRWKRMLAWFYYKRRISIA